MNSRVIEGASATDNASRQATQLLEQTVRQLKGRGKMWRPEGRKPSRPSLALCH